MATKTYNKRSRQLPSALTLDAVKPSSPYHVLSVNMQTEKVLAIPYILKDVSEWQGGQRSGSGFVFSLKGQGNKTYLFELLDADEELYGMFNTSTEDSDDYKHSWVCRYLCI